MINLGTIIEIGMLFVSGMGLLLLFVLLNMGDFYVKACESRGFIHALFKIAKIPVTITKKISPPYRHRAWPIEKNPPEWLSQDVINFKNKLTWSDRAEFWHLLLRSGTYHMNKKINKSFLPQLVATGIKNIFKKLFKVLISFPKTFKKFKDNPIKSYLDFFGSVSGDTINWICSRKYFHQFVKITKDAGFPIGVYFGKRYKALEIINAKNPALKAMQTIMIVYVLFGLAPWEKHIYPFNDPEVIVINDNEIVVKFCGDPYKCPHRGLKHPSVCQAFVSWENGLVQAVHPRLRSYVSKSLANGDQSCDVVVKFLSKK